MREKILLNPRIFYCYYLYILQREGAHRQSHNQELKKNAIAQKKLFCD